MPHLVLFESFGVIFGDFEGWKMGELANGGAQLAYF